MSAPWPPFLTGHHALFAALLATSLLAWFGLVVLFLYIASVMRFVLFDSVVERVCHVRRGWARRRHAGIRLFCWQLVFSLASLGALLIFIAIPVACAALLGWFTRGSEHVLGLVLGGITLLFILLVLLVAIGVIHMLTKDFVVPQMALEDISALEGWRRLWPCLRAEKAGYAVYVGMKIVLAIGAAILFGIISVIALLVLLIPLGGAGVLAVLGGRAAGWEWNVYTITVAAVFACVALLILIFAAALISVPVAVFFPAYSIYFFAPRFPPLAALLWAPPTAPEMPAAPA
jgi:hypothetical protein